MKGIESLWISGDVGEEGLEEEEDGRGLRVGEGGGGGCGGAE